MSANAPLYAALIDGERLVFDWSQGALLSARHSIDAVLGPDIGQEDIVALNAAAIAARGDVKVRALLPTVSQTILPRVSASVDCRMGEAQGLLAALARSPSLAAAFQRLLSAFAGSSAADAPSFAAAFQTTFDQAATVSERSGDFESYYKDGKDGRDAWDGRDARDGKMGPKGAARHPTSHRLGNRDLQELDFDACRTSPAPHQTDDRDEDSPPSP